MADYKFLSVSVEEAVATVQLNRPPVNALSRDFLREIQQAIEAIQKDSQAKAVVIASAIPNVFIAGVDLKEMGAITNPEEILEVLRLGQKVFSAVENSDKPVIAAIHGACVGGGQELAMACHIRIASDRTRFAQPEIALGIMPGFGGTQRLARIVGASRAAELILTGDLITPQDAFRIGLINRVVSDGALLKTARETAKKIARHGLPAIRASLRALRAGLDLPLEQGLRTEENEFKTLLTTRDMREGIQAFLEKRQPKFTDS
jgi:enoyl-CoA hydratase/carnithine racemase